MNEKSLLLYFAGYQGHNSQKFQVVKDFFENDHCECRQFDQTLDFEQDKSELLKIVAEGKNLAERKVYMIASSLGCLSALWLHFKHQFPLVLINPSFFPEETLKDSLSRQELENIKRFKKEIEDIRTGKEIYLFAAEDDERVDYRRFAEHFEPNILQTTISPDGGHAYTVLRKYIPFMHLLLWRKEIGFDEWPNSWEAEEWGFLPPYEEFLEGFEDYFK